MADAVGGGVKLNPNERKCLRALHAFYDSYFGGFGYVGFVNVAARTRLNRKEVRRAVRSLARKGLAHYARGLFNEDGEVVGSGYCCTKSGAEWLEANKR